MFCGSVVEKPDNFYLKRSFKSLTSSFRTIPLRSINRSGSFGDKLKAIFPPAHQLALTCLHSSGISLQVNYFLRVFSRPPQDQPTLFITVQSEIHNDIWLIYDCSINVLYTIYKSVAVFLIQYDH